MKRAWRAPLMSLTSRSNASAVYNRRQQPQQPPFEDDYYEKESLLQNDRRMLQIHRLQSTGSLVVGFLLILLLVVAGWLIYALVRPPQSGLDTMVNQANQSLTIQSLVNAFARTITQQDWQGNAALFVSGGTSLANFRRAMTFLPLGNLVVDAAPAVAPVGSWRHHLEVYAGGFSSNHMSLTNCNMSFWSTTVSAPLQSSITCIATYAYTLAYPITVNSSVYPTLLTHFQVHFEAIQNPYSAAPSFLGWQFTYALALPNATTTLLSSMDTGVAPPGAITVRSPRNFRDLSSPSVIWTTLQDEIQALVENEQIQVALAVCKTQQYEALADIFDPTRNDTGLLCNVLQPAPVYVNGPLVCANPAFALDASCLPDRIRTINSIVPEPSNPPMLNSLDFTITGGVGIAVQGGMHGITIHNVGIAVLNLIAPFPFYFTKVLSFISPSITLHLNDTAPHTVWAGPASGPAAPPVFRLLELADIPLIDLSSHVNGTLPLANGGTGNAGPFAGGRIIVSNPGGTALDEAPAMPDGFFPVSDGAGGFQAGTLVPGAGMNITYSGGIFTIIDIEAQSVKWVDLAVPLDLFQVTSMPVTDNGTLTFAAIAQGANKVWIGPTSGPDAVPTFRVLQEVDMAVISLSGVKVSGVLPVGRGGTNNNGISWVGERVIMSDIGGATLTEAVVTGQGGISIAYGPGPTLTISGTGGTCTVNDTISQSCLDISTLTCPGGALGASCIPSALTLAALTLTGPASLGTSTTCAAPLSAPCYDISSQSCPGGFLNMNCINPNLVLTSLTVDTITANDIMLLNGTVTVTGVSNFEIVNATSIITDSIVLHGPMTCDPQDGISQDCYDISGISCTSPVSANCFPINITLADLAVTNDLQVNNVACLGSPLGNDCIPSRVRTINGIAPSAAPTLDFNIAASTGISVTPAVNGITIANTGVTSVGLSLPSSILSVTISPITTTGTLTAVLQSQAANTFWGAPDGASGVPSFRSILFADLPTNGSTTSIYFVDGAGNLDVAPLSLSLSVPTAEFALSGSPITNPTGSFSITKQTQLARTFWGGPTSGGAAQPSFRTLGLGDLLPLGLTNGQVLTGVTSGAPMGKTLVAGLNMMITEMAGSFVFDATNTDSFTNLTLTVPSWLTVSPATLYSSGTFDITANTQAAHTFLAGPTSGGADVPSFRTLGYGDLPALADGQIYIGLTGSAPVPTQLTAGSLIAITPGPGTSTVSTSALGMVTLTMPISVFSVSSSSSPNAQTLTVSFATQTANTVWAGPGTGSPAAPSFRLLLPADIPLLDASIISTGILPIARGGTNSGTALTNGKLMVSSGGAIVEGTSSSTPSFTSATLSATSNQLTLGTTNTATISATAPAASRTYTIPDPGANANFVMDSASALTITNAGSVGQVLRLATATTATWQTVVGTGSVTSVGLALPASVFSISGSPVTTTGTLTGTFNTQTANTFFAGPTSGGAAVPTFRSLVTADLPVAILLSYSEAASTTPIMTFSSAAYTVATTMVLTPAAGTYWCSFSGSIIPTTSSGFYDVALHLNGVIIAHSARHANGASAYFNMHTLAVITTPGGQDIDVRWRKVSGSGTADMYERSLYCLRIG